MATNVEMNAKRVSVIIPTYNRGHFIERALQSLFNQTRVPDEIIIVDDGSTDHTLEILQPYADRVIILSDGKNEGPASARNRGLDVATGDFIAFLDSDDTLPLDSIERRLSALMEQPQYSVVYGDAQFIDRHGQVISRFSQFRSTPGVSGDVYFDFLQKNQSPIHTFMVRRTPQTATLRMDTTLRTLEDYDYWLKLAECCQFLYLDAVLADYHIHIDMTTSVESQAMRSNRIVVQAQALKRPRFQQLVPVQQARILTQIGASIAAVNGNMPDARSTLRDALRLKPMHLPAWFYWLITWTGRRGVNALNGLRRLVLSRHQHGQFPSESAT